MFRGSLTIARLAGIPIRLHWTFALLLGWILVSDTMHGGTLAHGLTSAAFTLSVFFCVVLHELGHALAARRYGVRTLAITLLPIGGVASLERIPEKPLQEIVIALAGPLVNVVIGGMLLAGLAWREGGVQGVLDALLDVDDPAFRLNHFLGSLALVNLWLVLFNMIPALPMDGGRVLRATLAAVFDHDRATKLAVGIGRGMALLMAAAGAYLVHPTLLLIAAFVWFAAGVEMRASRLRTALRGLPVSVAAGRLLVMAESDSLGSAAGALDARPGHDLAVTGSGASDDVLRGVLAREELTLALSRLGRDATLRDALSGVGPHAAAAGESDPLDRVVEALRSSPRPIALVTRSGRLVGVVTPRSVGELLSRPRPEAGVPQSPA